MPHFTFFRHGDDVALITLLKQLVHRIEHLENTMPRIDDLEASVESLEAIVATRISDHALIRANSVALQAVNDRIGLIVDRLDKLRSQLRSTAPAAAPGVASDVTGKTANTGADETIGTANP